MTGRIIIKGSILTPKEHISNGQVDVEDRKIVYVGKEKNADDGLTKVFKECWVVPGFIDLHMHGGGGSDVMEASEEALNSVSEFLASGGVTSFLATTYSASHEETIAVCEAVSRTVNIRMKGASLLGLNLEGPYINPMRKGAQDAKQIRKPNIEELREIYVKANGMLKIVTLAPEIEGAIEAVTWLNERKVIVAAGHTDATYEEMMKGVEAGVRHSTHLYNAMRPFRHREPGVLGVSLMDERVSVELIADGIHVHPLSLKLASTLKGNKNTVLVSDSIMPTGLPDGEYHNKNRKFLVEGGRCILKSGVLAGSNIRLCEAVRNMVRLAGVSVANAVEMATLSPARVLGLEEKKGKLQPGLDADLTVLNKDFSVLFSMSTGKVVYERR